ncbi:glycine cleavage system H protein [Catenulispora sp. GP43]|uniref:glycine cleavage system protein GcvH n=1 Tax=Catenulispora sp. GP43 TaxID=3156263 RepID=UPI0035182397
MTLPPDLLYTSEHEWLRIEGEHATIGVTAFAAEALGDIVYVALPAVGQTVAAGTPCGELESTKSVSDLYSPVTGEVIEVNDDLAATPESIGTDPYAQGWLFRVRVEELGETLDAAAYADLTRAG